MMYLFVLSGLVLLFIGGEALVRGSVSVARKLNISELVIGLTLVGFGTSVPELVTCLQAVQNCSVGIDALPISSSCWPLPPSSHPLPFS